MNTHLTAVCAAITLSFSAFGSQAAVLGQPLLVAELNNTGFVLDFFQGGFPSDVKEVDVSGTVTSSVGVSGFIGTDISISTNILGEVEIETTQGLVSNFGLGAPLFFNGSLPMDPIFTDEMLSFQIDAEFSDDTTFVFDALLGEDVFTINPFGGDVAVVKTGDPFVTIGVNIFYDSLPIKLFDDGMGTLANYVEGSFTPTRIELGLVNGPAISTVPLPTGVLLLGSALALLGASRKLKNP